MTELKKDDVITLDITDLNNLGNGVGRYPDEKGRVVFVRGAVSGDRVRAKIIKTSSDFAVARLEEILVSSPCRIEKDECTAPMSCGGCVYRAVSYEHELELKHNYVKNAFFKAGLKYVNILPVVSTGEFSGYRNKGQYPLTQTKNGVSTGFYAAKTHKIIPSESCAIQNPIFSKITAFVCDFATQKGISIYDEISGKGLIRHIYLRIGELTGEVMLCLVINGKKLPFAEEFVSLVTKKFPFVVSIMLNINEKNTNVVLGERYISLFGKGGIEDELCGLRFFITPQSFYQVNRKGAQLLYQKAKDAAELRGGEIIADLYCGTGTIGLSMADRAKKLYGIEINESAVECARENAKRNGIENAEFLAADAGDPQNILGLTKGVVPDVVIIDPPRKGSTRELAECLADLGVERVVYVSCDADTLARDCTYFAENGYIIGDVQPVDMFPRTGHVECVAVLKRNESFLIDLHLHIDGAISVENAIELSKITGVSLPTDNKDELISYLQVGRECKSLGEYLECFKLPCKLLCTPTAISHAIYRIQEELKAEGIFYAELRFAPQLHTESMTQEEVVKAAIDGLQRSDLHSGLILCCMRGENNREANYETVRLASLYGGKGVLAVDLAGNEFAYPTEDYREIFAYAKSLGVRFTLHAGEAAGADSVKTAVEFGASRIGHGVRSIESEEVLAQLAEKKIPLEVCITSNLQTKAIASLEACPVKALMKKGVAVTLNTDNPTVSGTSMNKELSVAKALGLSKEEIRALLLNSAEYSFASSELKETMKKNINKNFSI